MGLHDLVHALGARAKRWALRRRVRYLSRLDWDAWHEKVFRMHPEYRRPAPRRAERRHLELWRPLRPDVKLDTFRACYNMSGCTNPRIVPEEVYTSEIQAALNRYDLCLFLDNKNFLNRWLPDGLAPEAYLHGMDGQLYDGCYEPLEPARVGRLLDRIEYPAVFKPSMGSGGIGVHFVGDRRELERRMEGARNFVVQRMIRQHEFFDRFYSQSLNTIRVCVYRSVRDEGVRVLNAAMRMGKGGSLDNLTSGGIVRFVHDDGTLNDFALDNWGERFLAHPDTGVDFTVPERVPRYEELKELAVRLTRQCFLTRLVSFDFCMDADGNWRVVEINLRNQTIQMAQYAGRPFFEPFTHEVIEYCRQNPRWTVTLPP